MQRLWLIRHGSTLWNSDRRFCGHSDISLSPLGIQQAHWLADQLSSIPLLTLYSSDLSRAKQTASIIAQRQVSSPTIHLSSAWREISFGAWEGLTYAQIADRYPDHLDFFTAPGVHTPPSGEPFADFIQRIQLAFHALLNDAAGENVALICHGGVLRALLCYLLAIPYAQQWRLHIDPGSLSALDYLSAADVLTTGSLTLLNLHSASLPTRGLER